MLSISNLSTIIGIPRLYYIFAITVATVEFYLDMGGAFYLDMGGAFYLDMGGAFYLDMGGAFYLDMGGAFLDRTLGIRDWPTLWRSRIRDGDL